MIVIIWWTFFLLFYVILDAHNNIIILEDTFLQFYEPAGTFKFGAETSWWVPFTMVLWCIDWTQQRWCDDATDNQEKYITVAY